MGTLSAPYSRRVVIAIFIGRPSVLWQILDPDAASLDGLYVEGRGVESVYQAKLEEAVGLARVHTQ